MRSSIREYLCSEAMAGLGIPTTRALCVIATNEQVHREAPEPGAVLTRLARSHIRFGHFEHFHHNGKELVRLLADHVIGEYMPDFTGDHAAWFGEVVKRTAHLIAHWQAAGFAHGVMNTDNMSILGLTLDYGPFGFLDAYEPGFICNHSDETGNPLCLVDMQPAIAHWNLPGPGFGADFQPDAPPKIWWRCWTLMNPTFAPGIANWCAPSWDWSATRAGRMTS